MIFSLLSIAPSQAAHIRGQLILTFVASSIAIGETASTPVTSKFTGVSGGASITVTSVQFSPNASSGTLAFTT